MISINNICVEFSARPLFTDVSFVVNPTDKIALTGKNGAGKSTLLKIISGLQQPTSGSLGMPDGLTVAYLPQQMEVADSTTLFDDVKQAFSSHLDLERELELVNTRIAEATDYESDEYAALLDRQLMLQERIDIESPGNGRRD